MMIHSVLRKQRRLLGLTQEQVAERLGVTAPAVNKWEKGTTCPDIALLPPLAKLLQVDLNTLFGFHEDITQEELATIRGQIHQVSLSEGLEAGFALALEKKREYPNSDKLLYNLALQLQGLLTLLCVGEEAAAGYQEEIGRWYEELAESEEPVTRNGACYMLASRAIVEERYEQAQAWLDEMPNRNDTPDKRMMQASIYLRQNRAADTAKLMEESLVAAVNEMQMVLYQIIEADLAMGDREAAAYAAERATMLAKALDLSEYNQAVAPFFLAVADENASLAVEHLRTMLRAMTAVERLQDSPLYRHIQIGGTGTSMAQMIPALLESLNQDPKYACLREDASFLSLLSEYGT